MDNFSKNKKFTVTVGVPAYNEEANIKNLLNSILSQRKNNFELEKLIVLSDNSNDRTDEIVQNIIKENSSIELIADGQRKGKNERLNQLYKMNRSDIVVNFDADILLKDEMVLEKMVDAFRNSEVGIVSANSRPTKAINFAQKMANASENLWYEVRKDLNEGDNIYNIPGCATAITRSFAENFSFPKNSCADEIFQYLASKEKKLKFLFVKDAIVLYNSPSKLNELFRQFSRFLNNKNNATPYFSNNIIDIEKIFKAPFSFKIRGVSKSLIANPLYTTIVILFQIALRIFPTKDDMHKKGMWNVVISTKKAINNYE